MPIDPRPRGRALVALATFVFVASAFGLLNGSASGMAAAPSLGAPFSPVLVPGPSHAVGHPGSTMASPRPAVTLNCQDGSNDAYNPISGVVPLFPMWPNPSFQTPCTLTAQDPNIGGVYNDEAHLTLSSNAAGSGSHFSVPIRLPTAGSFSEVSFLPDFYVALVVSGDQNSTYNQSLFQVIFTPAVALNGSLDFKVTLSVFSIYTSSVGPPTACDSHGLPFSWNNAFACEEEVLGGGAGIALTGPIPQGQALTVTFSGTAKDTVNGVKVWVNDSSQSIFSKSYSLSKSVATHGNTFSPFYKNACADLCYLNWSMPFGNGFGADLNYNTLYIPYQQAVNPIGIGAPHYETSTGYDGEFTYIAFMSSSGICSGQSLTLPCGTLGGYESWPYFQFNGTLLDFGSANDFNWTTNNFGGVYSEFNAAGTPNDVVPLFVDTERNGTPAGYVQSGSSVTVSVRAQDFGAVDFVNLSYTVPGGGSGTLAMLKTAGTTTDGTYSATIPGGGGDGTITYQTEATNHAGQKVKLPSYGSHRLVRGPIPRFTIDFRTDPPACGNIGFNGINYTSFANVTLPADQYVAIAHVCYPYVFLRWDASGLTLDRNTLRNPVILVNLTANATLVAHFKYIRPYDSVSVAIDTNHCGAIVLNRTTYATNTTVRLLDGFAYPLSYTNCALNSFSGWVVSLPYNLTILGGSPGSTVTLHGNGTIELTFLPQSPSTIALVFDVIPAKCGGILFRGAGYTNGTVVDVHAGSSYAIAADPCPTWGLQSFTVTSGITISNGTSGVLVASAPGTVTYTYYALTIITFETYPAYCGYIVFDGRSYHQNDTAIVPAGSTHTAFAFPCGGYSFQGFYASGGVFASGNAVVAYSSGILEAVFVKGVFKDFVAFLTDPGTCFTPGPWIEFNGVNYTGGGFTSVLPHTTAVLVPWPCAGYGFVFWTLGGTGIELHKTPTGSWIAYINGSGSITGVFHPLVPVLLATFPSNCGAIVINGVPHTNGARVNLASPGNYFLNAIPCPFYAFDHWVTSSGESASNGTLILTSTATLAAVFQPVLYVVTLDTHPGSCGAIRVTWAGTTNSYANNTPLALPHGSFPLFDAPCSGFHTDHWNATGNVSVVNVTTPTVGWRVVVNGTGNLTAFYLPAAPVLSLAAPGSVYQGTTISLSVHVATPVPGRYTYDWVFGDGTNATTSYDFNTHNYARTGKYVVLVTVHDPYKRTAQATATISVVQPATSALGQIGVSGYVAIAAAIVAVGAAVLLATRGPRRSAEPPGSAPPTGANAPGDPSGPSADSKRFK